MTKSELTELIAESNPNLSAREVEKIVKTFFESISAQLTKNGRVELRGFGAFSTKPRKARVARNPRTGSDVRVQAKRTPYFKAGKGLATKLNVKEST